MYNPFPLLTPGLLKEQIAKGKKYFVRQTFSRGMEGKLKAAFLIRSYEEQEEADKHWATLSRDGNAFVYDISLPGHLERLKTAATQPFGYKVFYAAKKGIDWKPPQTYEDKIRHYIRTQHPAWRTQRDSTDKIEVGLYEEYGELFLKFSFDKEEDTIPFDWIEKY